ncbi:carboxylesterase family protein [Dyadobacter jejuensis]|uniref:Carboxylesterase family protein n=1 Tax=Dyadobacter jejuensis TaxID=1082580 RepID=A0A316AMX3_9BACT|nr:carboxylesterase family protein [Dyadobacter jejuensis]
MLSVLFWCTHCFSHRTKTDPTPSGDTLVGVPIPEHPDFVLDTTRTSDTDSLLGASQRFGTQQIFELSELTHMDGQYSQQPDFSGKSTTLGFTFVAPHPDTMSRRPFILILHEGALLFGDRGLELEKAKLLAQKGFAVATIDYRLGFAGGSQQDACGSNSQEVAKAIYRATQDTFTALHFFLSQSEQFGLDSAQVFLAGSSAGAIVIASLAYMTERDFSSLFPGISSVLGPLDALQAHRQFKLRGLLTTTGFALPVSNQFRATNARPTLFFQKEKDDILPNILGPLFGCNHYFNCIGSDSLSKKLAEHGIATQLNIETGQGHLLAFPNQYIVDQYAAFIRRLWNKDYRQRIYKDYDLMMDQPY